MPIGPERAAFASRAARKWPTKPPSAAVVPTKPRSARQATRSTCASRETKRAGRESPLAIFLVPDNLDRYVARPEVALETVQCDPSFLVGHKDDTVRLELTRQSHTVIWTSSNDSLETVLMRETQEMFSGLPFRIDNEQDQIALFYIIPIVVRHRLSLRERPPRSASLIRRSLKRRSDG